MFKIIVIVVIIAIIASLGSALIAMIRGGGANEKAASDKMFKSLVWRVALSMSLFILLIIAYSFGFIEPLNNYPR